MDYIQKTVEDWENSELKKRIDALELFAINHGFPEWDKQTIPDFLTRALTEQANLYRQGLGEEELFKEDFKCGGCGECEACKLQNDDVTAGSNMRRTQTLENWEKAGI